MSEPDTKDMPGAFDAFETAKPDEPIFTLQGGDPAASKLVLLWALLARYRAGILQAGMIDFDTSFLPLATTEAERQELLLRASSAEDVAWRMDAYRKGEAVESDASKAYEQSRTEAEGQEADEALQRLFRHKALVNCARRLDNCVAELAAVDEELKKLDFRIEPDVPMPTVLATGVKLLSRFVRPHR